MQFVEKHSPQLTVSAFLLQKKPPSHLMGVRRTFSKLGSDFFSNQRYAITGAGRNDAEW